MVSASHSTWTAALRSSSRRDLHRVLRDCAKRHGCRDEKIDRAPLRRARSTSSATSASRSLRDLARHHRTARRRSSGRLYRRRRDNVLRKLLFQSCRFFFDAIANGCYACKRKSQRSVEMDVSEPHVRRRGFFLHSDTGEPDTGELENPEGFIVRVKTNRSVTSSKRSSSLARTSAGSRLSSGGRSRSDVAAPPIDAERL